MHWAAWRGHEEVAELLIAKGADVNTKNKDGGTPLHNATWKGHKEIAKLLIDNGADVNAKRADEEAWTPLHSAAWMGHKEIAELLITKGADVNTKNDDGETPLDVAIGRNQPETANLLRKHGGKTKKELKAEGK